MLVIYVSERSFSNRNTQLKCPMYGSSHFRLINRHIIVAKLVSTQNVGSAFSILSIELNVCSFFACRFFTLCNMFLALYYLRVLIVSLHLP